MKTDRYETRKRRRRVHIDEIDKIFFAVTEVTGVTKESMKSKVRRQHLSDARHLFCYMTWKFTSLPLEVIGESINRNHSSVIHSRDIVSGLKDVDKFFCEKLKDATNIYMSL